MTANRSRYLFPVNRWTPPVMSVASGEDLRLEVRGARHGDVGELGIGTSPRPVMATRLIVPEAPLRAAGWRGKLR